MATPISAQAFQHWLATFKLEGADTPVQPATLATALSVARRYRAWKLDIKLGEESQYTPLETEEHLLNFLLESQVPFDMDPHNWMLSAAALFDDIHKFLKEQW